MTTFKTMPGKSPYKFPLLILLLCSLMSPLSAQLPGAEPKCKEALGRSTDSVLYVSHSTYVLSYDDVQHENFADFGTTYEEGLFCDPALYYGADSTFANYFEVVGMVDWDTVPSGITMLNVTLLQQDLKFDLESVQLDRFTSLQSLGLRGGVIPKPNVTLFQNFPDLNILDLSGNGITVLPKGLLQPLQNLMIFLFHDNDLQEYHPDLFCNLPSLFSINMNHAFETGAGFPLALFSSRRLRDQDLVGCNASQTYSNVQILRLSRNKFPTLNDASFDRLGNINNELQLAGCGIHTIESNAFSGLPNLEILLLDDNSISNIHIGLFKSVGNLVQMSLSNNSISYISGSHFQTNSRIDALDFSRNNLRQLSGNWQHLNKLFHLKASHNKIAHLGDNAISNIESLKELYLDHNEIQRINPKALQGLGRGDYFHLVLSHNKIEEIDPTLFEGMSALSDINLENNMLTSLDAMLFQNKTNLKAIYLNNNAISHIDKDAFASVPNLMILHLANNSITHLHKDTLVHQGKLAVLELSSNFINELDDELFREQTTLRILSLDSNNLNYFNGSLLEKQSTALIGLGLSENPWNCSCNLAPLVSWVKAHNIILKNPKQTLCQFPESVTGTRLQAVSLEHCIDKQDNNPQVASASNSGYIVLGIVIVLILLTVVAVSVYFRREIEVLLFSKFKIRLRKTKSLSQEKVAQMKYDAFVSYNMEYIDFVKNKLMTTLEGERDAKLKLCLPFRDLSSDVPIADNVGSAIEQSSKTILLLSRSFLNTEWCQHDFQQAHHKLMAESRLLIIFMETIDIKGIMDEQLRNYIMNQPCIHNKKCLFWERLHFEMPPITIEEARTKLAVASPSKPSASSIDSLDDEVFVTLRKDSRSPLTTSV